MSLEVGVVSNEMLRNKINFIWTDIGFQFYKKKKKPKTTITRGHTNLKNGKEEKKLIKLFTVNRFKDKFVTIQSS